MNGGIEWIIDAYGCTAEILQDLESLRRCCHQALGELEVRVIGSPQWFQFPDPGGVTGLYLLGESHLTCHTFPESELATFNLYCCRPRPTWRWEQHLTKCLGARRVDIRTLVRGNPQLGDVPELVAQLAQSHLVTASSSQASSSQASSSQASSSQVNPTHFCSQPGQTASENTASVGSAPVNPAPVNPAPVNDAEGDSGESLSSSFGTPVR